MISGGYNYELERGELFTEDGLETLLKIRDRAFALIKEAGAASCDRIISRSSGNSWTMLAAIDYLVETKQLVPLSHPEGMDVWTQDKCYTRPVYR